MTPVKPFDNKNKVPLSTHAFETDKWSNAFSSSALFFAQGNDDSSKNGSIAKYVGTILLALLGIQSVVNLTNELPVIFQGGPNPDYFGAIFDTLFFGYAGQTLLLQTGALADSADDSDSISLDGLECRINVDVGREQGTWMDKDWAASGGRLVLPVNVVFTNDRVDLGIPGEEGLGGRYCRKLEVLEDTVTIVGPSGQVQVPVSDGGWATLPILNKKLEQGERKLRFFLDFPIGAQRNDVTIPSGRVFFSSSCFPKTADLSQVKLGTLSAVKTPSGASICSEGGVTIKGRGNIFNLWGAAGDINLILGRYTIV